MFTVSTADFKKRLGELLDRVMSEGDTIVVTRRGRPVAQVSPVGEGPLHLAEVGGWLEDDDPFLQIMDEIVRRRKTHLPRIWSY